MIETLAIVATAPRLRASPRTDNGGREELVKVFEHGGAVRFSILNKWGVKGVHPLG